jgi:hypothetical protein
MVSVHKAAKWTLIAKDYRVEVIGEMAKLSQIICDKVRVLSQSNA